MAKETYKDETAGLPLVTDIPDEEPQPRRSFFDRFKWKNMSYIARLTLAFVLVAVMTILVAIIVLSAVWNEHFTSYTRDNMFSIAQSTASSIAREYEREGGWSTDVITPAVNAAANNTGVGVVVIDVSGTTRYDSSLTMSDDGETVSESLMPSSLSQLASASITVDSETVGTVYVWVYGSETLMRQTDQQFRDNSYQAMAISAVLAILLACAIGYLFARQLVKPINRMTETAREIEEGDLTARTGMTGTDEVSRLGETFDDMAESIETSIMHERRLTTDVAHELRSPLQAIQMNVEAMIDGVYPTDTEHLVIINDEVARLGRMVTDLLELSRLESGTMPMREEVVDVGEAVQNLMMRYDLLFEDYNLQCVVECEEGVVVKGDEGKLCQAVTNLISNAIRYTPEGGTITVAVTKGDIMANIMVKDTGIGLTPEEARQVFDRFWRADNSRTRDTGGLGIGLSLVKEIVQRHGGWVQVEGQKGEGSTFTIHLPLYHEQVQKISDIATSKSRTGKIPKTRTKKN